jgi:hypothetical protein
MGFTMHNIELRQLHTGENLGFMAEVANEARAALADASDRALNIVTGYKAAALTRVYGRCPLEL